MFTNNTINEAYNRINAQKARSAWERGVRDYAADLLDQLDENIRGGWFDAEALAEPLKVRRELLNGADNWEHYSWGGCSLCYDGQIAERLCTPSELKRNRNGALRPNRSEEWLDVQTRALYQAAHLVRAALAEVTK